MRSKIIVILYFIIQCAYGQPEVPVVPSASTINGTKNADIQPNLYTGSFNLPIPLTTVFDGSLQLPINLEYHSSIRAHEISSEAGLGWNNSAASMMISRRVLNLPDDCPDKGFWYTGADAQDVESGYGHYLDDDYIDGNKDSQADLFTYNLGNLSGRFVMDYTQVAHHVPQSDIEIKYVKDLYYFASGFLWLPYYYFLLTTPDGTRYYFGSKPENGGLTSYHEIVEPEDEDSYVSNWYLYKIESFDSSSVININYTPHSYKYYSLQNCTYLESNDSSCEMEKIEVSVE